MRFFCCPHLLLLVLAAPLLAREPSDEAVQQPAPLISQGTLNTGIETAGNTTDGQFSVLLPLHSTVGETGVLAGTLVFAEPFASWIERGSVDAGLGLGVRHLFGGQPVSALSEAPGHLAGFLEEGWYVGANLYGNLLQTSDDVRYWQMVPGVEIGTRYLELRGHYQLPLTDGETTYVSHTSTFRSNLNLQYFGGTRLVGHSVFTYHSTTNILHESLEGWDLEAAALVPWLDRYMDLKIVGGYASFHSTSVRFLDYDSWKTGLELRPFPACVLSATYYTNQRLVGDQMLYGIRLELPFETANIGDGQGGFWGHIKAAFKPRRRHLAERLFESAHAHQLEPQIANYVTGGSFKFKSQFHGAFILADGTVISVRRTGTASILSTAGNGTTQTADGTVATAGSTTYAGAVTVNAGSFFAGNPHQTAVAVDSGTLNATIPINTSSGSGDTSTTPASSSGSSGSTSYGQVSGFTFSASAELILGAPGRLLGSGGQSGTPTSPPPPP